jgi:sulfite exporter TauE/SafE
MNFDLRLPIGILFTIFGVILSVYGFATQGSEMYEKSLGKNINIIWGLFLLAFGLLMLALAKFGKKS